MVACVGVSLVSYTHTKNKGNKSRNLNKRPVKCPSNGKLKYYCMQLVVCRHWQRNVNESFCVDINKIANVSEWAGKLSE